MECLGTIGCGTTLHLEFLWWLVLVLIMVYDTRCGCFLKCLCLYLSKLCGKFASTRNTSQWKGTFKRYNLNLMQLNALVIIICVTSNTIYCCSLYYILCQCLPVVKDLQTKTRKTLNSMPKLVGYVALEKVWPMRPKLTPEVYL